ncbi:MAG: site-specific integrase [Sphaerochaetaceae bacterium]|nr:site-specific integrase [Sphaerochaetaceae bacterium]
MEKNPKKLENYLNTLDDLVGKINSKLIKKHIDQYRALPSEPKNNRLLLVAMRLKTISKFLNNKSLINLNEDDLITLNNAMRERQFKSARDYRKTLKKFLLITDRKKYDDLIHSVYLQNPAERNKKLVDPSQFWSQKEVNNYLEECKRHSLRQSAFAGLLFSTGCRPHEIFALKKKHLNFENEQLLVRVPKETKTGGRLIVLNNTEGKGAWAYIKPYLDTLENEMLLFETTYEAQSKLHKRICDKIKLGEDKSRKFYIARKMCLTKFYNEYHISKATALAGHTAGGNAMKHYIGLTDAQLKDEPIVKVQAKICPNPKCEKINEAHLNQCAYCGSPLDKKQFSDLIEKNIADLIDAKIDLLKQTIENQLLKKKVGL